MWRDKRCRSSAEEIIEALCGDYREEYLFVLGQSQRTYRQLREAIAACDEKLGELADRVECGLVIDDLALCSALLRAFSSERRSAASCSGSAARPSSARALMLSANGPSAGRVQPVGSKSGGVA